MIVKEDLIMAGENIFGRLKKITEQVTEKGKIALDKGVTQASFALEKSKLNSQIDGINKEIKKLIHSLGEAAYIQWENGNEDFKSLEGIFQAIQQKKEEIVELNKKIAEIEVQEQQLMESATVTNVNIEVEESVAKVQEGMVQAEVSREITEELSQVQENIEVQGEEDVQPEIQEEVEAVEDAKAGIVCPGCGAQYDAPAKFCKNCGTKMQ